MIVRPESPAAAYRIRGSVIADIGNPLLFFVLVATAVAIAHEQFGLFTHGLTVAPFSLLGVVLGLYVGFKNSASYDRFWEGRKLWGQLVNTSRTLARDLATYINPSQNDQSPEDAGQAVMTLTRMQIAFVHALRGVLRNEHLGEEVTTNLPPLELSVIRDEHNSANYLLHRMGERLRDQTMQGRIHPLHLPALTSSLTVLADVQGGCERIKNTPIPYSYTYLIRRIVWLYCLALPFGLVELIGYHAIFVELLVAYAFLGLLEVGRQLEHPFQTEPNCLPLFSISTTIEKDLKKRLGYTPLPEVPKPVKGILY